MRKSMDDSRGVTAGSVIVDLHAVGGGTACYTIRIDRKATSVVRSGLGIEGMDAHLTPAPDPRERSASPGSPTGCFWPPPRMALPPTPVFIPRRTPVASGTPLEGPQVRARLDARFMDSMTPVTTLDSVASGR
jgi:hypothetical protein